MNLFHLPASTVVDKIVPKSAFDRYTTSRQKKLLVDVVERIRWTNKLSFETLNLSGQEIKEIQVFQIELRMRDGYKEVLDIVNKAIPYPIIACLIWESECLISTCQKHSHPVNPDNAVIDWVFSGDWHNVSANPYMLNLRKSLDFVYLDLSLQLTGKQGKAVDISGLTAFEKQRTALLVSIERLEAAVAKSRQFNKKVELNLELKKKKEELGKMEELFEG